METSLSVFHFHCTFSSLVVTIFKSLKINGNFIVGFFFSLYDSHDLLWPCSSLKINGNFIVGFLFSLYDSHDLLWLFSSLKINGNFIVGFSFSLYGCHHSLRLSSSLKINGNLIVGFLFSSYDCTIAVASVAWITSSVLGNVSDLVQVCHAQRS
jgi:hypothetical protein